MGYQGSNATGKVFKIWEENSVWNKNMLKYLSILEF